MVTLKIHVDDDKKGDIATLIHTGLRGYDEYINSNIVLNFTDQDEILLSIGPENIDNKKCINNTMLNLKLLEEN